MLEYRRVRKMIEIIQQNEINKIVKLLNNGKIVAIPTETVYGLAVKYNDKEALNNLFIAKNRPENKSVTLMVPTIQDIEKYAYVNDSAKKVIHHFMPGMITLIFNKKENVSKEMTCGRNTIGIRIPNHQLMLEILDQVGPMLVTSANLSGSPNTTNTQEVLDQLNNRIDAVVEGNANSTIASTVVDVSSNEIKILREGQITLKEIEEVL